MYLSHTSLDMPTASNSMQPRYERMVAMPIFDMIFSMPFSAARM